MGSFSNLLINKNNNNSSKNLSFDSNINDNNKNKELDNNLDGNYQEAILNKSNKSTILIFKRYYIIMIIISILMLIFCIYKIRNDYLYTKESSRFFTDFKVIATRYADLYYYFITLKDLLVSNEKDYRGKNCLIVMESMMDCFDKSNNDYFDVLLLEKMTYYSKVKNLFEILQYNKNDSSRYINDNVCGNITTCQDYLKTKENIFSSGIDNGYRTCFIYMNNIVEDYKNMKNKTDIEEIKSTITGDQFYEFKRIRKSFTNIFYYIQQMIYSSFEEDNYNFRIKKRSIINSLNIYSIAFSILIFLFVILVIFKTIDNFIKPIQDSTFRLNNSFCYIEKY